MRYQARTYHPHLLRVQGRRPGAGVQRASGPPAGAVWGAQPQPYPLHRAWHTASGGMAGVAYKPLIVDAHEPGVVAKVAQENQFGPWSMLSDKEQQQLGAPWGPATPQALNRYSYVLNNPMKWTDPGGHSVYVSQKQAANFVAALREAARSIRAEDNK